MTATILRQIVLPDLPSASGIEVLGEVAYVIGDDSPLLYCLDAATLKPNAPIRLFETAHFGTGRIPKNLKPDLECLTAASDAGQNGLLIMGSGATAAREIGFWVDLPKHHGAEAEVHPLSLSVLYAAFRKALPGALVLNLESAAATATELFLLQRSVGTAAGNLLFRGSLAGTLNLLRHRSHVVPAFRPQLYQLPSIEGKPAGFSGASVYKNKLFVTASVEDTVDAVADGAVLGSFVGIIDPQDTSTKALPVQMAQLQLPNGQPYRGKVEGVAVRREVSPHHYELLLVTDDDAGGSTAVVVELSMP
ncbi:DUF6929 family protein [Hymenobacter koreensis]|uniref:Uncharacterized protein n=1 Tax=Hymenobacter koreensis TaxID=1084523 RepID=A0ABP8IUW3_9BACT